MRRGAWWRGVARAASGSARLYRDATMGVTAGYCDAGGLKINRGTAVVKATVLHDRGKFQRPYTTRPPTIVVRTAERSIVSGGTRVRSWSSSTRSAA